MSSTNPISIRLPVELWERILQYLLGLPLNVVNRTQSVLSLRITCRAFHRAILELSLCLGGPGERQMASKSGVLTLPKPLLFTERAPLFSQKQAALALRQAPKEVLTSIRRLEGDFLSIGILPKKPYALSTLALWGEIPQLLCQMTHLQSIEGPFLQRYICPNRVDLQSLTSLTDIGSHFFAYSSITEILLPRSLEKVGDKFLFCTPLTHLDLSHTALKQTGSSFVACTTLSKLLLPPSLAEVGDGFLARCAVEAGVLDLSHTALKRCGPSFLMDATVETVVLPHCFEEAENDFMKRCAVKRLDLSQTQLKLIPNCFLAESQVEQVQFPSSLTVIGDSFLRQCSNLRKVDLSGTALERHGNGFLSQCKLKELRMPKGWWSNGR